MNGHSIKIEPAGKGDYGQLIQVWEASVRATHDFLAEEDIQYLKPLILEQYFDLVDLWCVRGDSHEQGRILGFCGVAEGSLEMLFVSPECRGQGIGSALCGHAVRVLGVVKVDVNEQNPQAKGFYESLGFRIVSKSPVDGQGKPYPILHMALT
ncbi:GNAT family N-acetyltransferase [Hahella ganghwensis]|uniref:GNAT family N-acetyltransferase n=1 Tax=Hahella ganghwensis TaxID=286420 RepID=UPI00035CBB08|nr:GNAT family N-acetyltransferase [Hahella ganghwensis]